MLCYDTLKNDMPNEVQNSNIYWYMKLHATVLIQTILNSYDKTKNYTECEVHCKNSVQIKSLKQLILVRVGWPLFKCILAIFV